MKKGTNFILVDNVQSINLVDVDSVLAESRQFHSTSNGFLEKKKLPTYSKNSQICRCNINGFQDTIYQSQKYLTLSTQVFFVKSLFVKMYSVYLLGMKKM